MTNERFSELLKMSEHCPPAVELCAEIQQQAHEILLDTSVIISLLSTSKWAIDLIEMYDNHLVQLGDPVDLVYSDAHKAGMQSAKDAIFAAHLRLINLQSLSKQQSERQLNERNANSSS